MYRHETNNRGGGKTVRVVFNYLSMKPAVELGWGLGRVTPPSPSPAPISQLMAISFKDDVTVILAHAQNTLKEFL